jgi:hypothetical protein
MTPYDVATSSCLAVWHAGEPSRRCTPPCIFRLRTTKPRPDPSAGSTGRPCAESARKARRGLRSSRWISGQRVRNAAAVRWWKDQAIERSERRWHRISPNQHRSQLLQHGCTCTTTVDPTARWTGSPWSFDSTTDMGTTPSGRHLRSQAPVSPMTAPRRSSVKAKIRSLSLRMTKSVQSTDRALRLGRRDQTGEEPTEAHLPSQTLAGYVGHAHRCQSPLILADAAMSAINRRPPGRSTRTVSSIARSRRAAPLTLRIARLETTTS